MIASPFPAPPDAVQEVLALLDLVASGDEAVIVELGDTSDLPRPWLPATCHPDLRRQVWHWCDDVVTWINHEYAWRPAGMIPGCWPLHPHLVHEVPTLACLRALAEQAYSPDQLEEWHRYTLPTFLDRAASRLGESSCRTGRHAEWPAGPRHDAQTDDASRAARAAVFNADTADPSGRHLAAHSPDGGSALHNPGPVDAREHPTTKRVNHMINQPIPTQPEPHHLGRAARLLEAVLLGGPETGLDTDTCLAVAAALARLDDVQPPYPPRPHPAAPIAAGEGIDQALGELAAAIAQTQSVEESIRVGLAARELRSHGRQP